MGGEHHVFAMRSAASSYCSGSSDELKYDASVQVQLLSFLKQALQLFAQSKGLSLLPKHRRTRLAAWCKDHLLTGSTLLHASVCADAAPSATNITMESGFPMLLATVNLCPRRRKVPQAEVFTLLVIDSAR